MREVRLCAATKPISFSFANLASLCRLLLPSSSWATFAAMRLSILVFSLLYVSLGHLAAGAVLQFYFGPKPVDPVFNPKKGITLNNHMLIYKSFFFSRLRALGSVPRALAQ